jgi:hypothetical protein
METVASHPNGSHAPDHDEAAALWDALQSIDALAGMPRHVVRAYVRSATEGWPRARARRFTHALHTLLRVRRAYGVIEAYPAGGRPRWR